MNARSKTEPIGVRCRNWRKSRKPALSQKQLAEMIGAYQSQLSDFENGKAALPAHAAFALQDVTRGRIKARDILGRKTRAETRND